MPETRPFTWHEGAGDTPPKGQEFKLSARFNIDPRVQKVQSFRTILYAFNQEKDHIRTIIGNTILRVYGRHGLKVRSGNLRAWAMNPANIALDFKIGGNAIIMTAQWQHPIIYACVQMWGHVFSHRGIAWVRPRPYIQFDNACLLLIERLISTRMLATMSTQYGRRSRAARSYESIRRKQNLGIVDYIGIRSKHKARRVLWKSNKYTQSDARKIIDVIWGNPALKQILEDLIRDTRKGYRLVRGAEIGRGA